MTKSRRSSKKRKPDYMTLTYGKRTVRFIADRVLIFRLMRNVHGRFWGLTGLFIMNFGYMICFLIRPDMLHISTALSDFGRDVRTAPYLAASLFFGAYGLWRWRNYLRRTLKHARPVTSLVTITVLGLYIAALMPIAWEPWPYRLHLVGVTISGVAIAATVVVDTLLTKVKRNRRYYLWRSLRLTSFLLIMVGGYFTLGSSQVIGWFSYTLIGEGLMITGYALWIIDKTYRGEGGRSQLSRILRKIVLID